MAIGRDEVIMARYEVENRNGTLWAVSSEGEVVIGDMDDVITSVGSETYTITYDEAQRTHPWLETDDGDLEIDVRDAVSSMRFSDETLEQFAGVSMDTSKYGLPERTVRFAETMIDIWEQQGAATDG